MLDQAARESRPSSSRAISSLVGALNSDSEAVRQLRSSHQFGRALLRLRPGVWSTRSRALRHARHPAFPLGSETKSQELCQYEAHLGCTACYSEPK